MVVVVGVAVAATAAVDLKAAPLVEAATKDSDVCCVAAPTRMYFVPLPVEHNTPPLGTVGAAAAAAAVLVDAESATTVGSSENDTELLLLLLLSVAAAGSSVPKPTEVVTRAFPADCAPSRGRVVTLPPPPPPPLAENSTRVPLFDAMLLLLLSGNSNTTDAC